MDPKISAETLDYVLGQFLQQQQQLPPQQQPQQLQPMYQPHTPQYQQFDPSTMQMYTLVENHAPQPAPQQAPQLMAPQQPIIFQMPSVLQPPAYQPQFTQPACACCRHDAPVNYQQPQLQQQQQEIQQQPTVFKYSFDFPHDAYQKTAHFKPLTNHRDRNDLIFKPSVYDQAAPAFFGGASSNMKPDFAPQHHVSAKGDCKVHFPKVEPPKPPPQEKTKVTAMLIYPPPQPGQPEPLPRHEHHEESAQSIIVLEPEPEPLAMLPSRMSALMFAEPEPQAVAQPTPEVWRPLEPGSIPFCAKCR